MLLFDGTWPTHILYIKSTVPSRSCDVLVSNKRQNRHKISDGMNEPAKLNYLTSSTSDLACSYVSQVKGRDPSHLSHREKLQFRGDGYEQPITMQIEGRHRRGRRRHHSQYPVSDCGTQTEQQSWEALRALGEGEGAGPGLCAYASGYVQLGLGLSTCSLSLYLLVYASIMADE